MFYPSSENKDTGQLCSYCTADMRLCFRIGKNPGFSYHKRRVLSWYSAAYGLLYERYVMNTLLDLDFCFTDVKATGNILKKIKRNGYE